MSLDVKMTKLAECAGCGAKVGAGMLAKLLDGLPVHTDERLLVGYDTSDDASVYRISDELALVQTVDFFPPIVDDPYTFGQIAAANALSDVYAMGGTPKLALNVLCVSPQMSDEAVREVLRGGYEKVYEAGAIITGGHSIQGKEPKYGLSVTGFVHPARVLRNDRAREGNVLILTKPLGIGVVTTARKAELCGDNLYRQAVGQMAELNNTARDIMVQFKVESCTDVTGFGLLGHALEMARGGGVTAVLESRTSLLPGAIGVVPMGAPARGNVPATAILPEGETPEPDENGVSRASWGLLYGPADLGRVCSSGVNWQDAFPLVQRLQDYLPCAEIIGHIIPKQDKSILVV